MIDTNMVVSESEWLRPPLKTDYKHAENILHDFGIVTIVPNFENYKKLQEWTQKQINRVLI